MRFDPRSIALFRIALGCILFVVTIQLSLDFAAFFQFSPYAWGIRGILDLVLPVTAALLALGCFTRTSTIVCWVCVILVQGANPHILYGADRLVRLLLFWSIFLPLGECWSIDALVRKTPRPALRQTEYWATWALTLQIAIIYWFSAIQKWDPVWTQSHDALFYAISMEYLATPLGLYLRQMEWLLRVLTVATLIVEFLGPFLLFIPFYRDRFRFLAVILFLSFHVIGMQLLLRIGYFPWICAIAWLIFIPGFFWDFLTGPAHRQPVAAMVSRRVGLVDIGATIVLFLAFADVLAWNVAGLRGKEGDAWMKSHDPLRPILHVDQTWRLFAPYPRPEHGWIVAPAQLTDGTGVDLFTQRPVSWAKPANLYDYYGEFRSGMLASSLYFSEDPEMIKAYVDYLTGRWNDAHPQNKVQTVSIVFMKETTLPNLTVSPPEKVVLYPAKQ